MEGAGFGIVSCVLQGGGFIDPLASEMWDILIFCANNCSVFGPEMGFFQYILEWP